MKNGASYLCKIKYKIINNGLVLRMVFCPSASTLSSLLLDTAFHFCFAGSLKEAKLKILFRNSSSWLGTRDIFIPHLSCNFPVWNHVLKILSRTWNSVKTVIFNFFSKKSKFPRRVIGNNLNIIRVVIQAELIGLIRQ